MHLLQWVNIIKLGSLPVCSGLECLYRASVAVSLAQEVMPVQSKPGMSMLMRALTYVSSLQIVSTTGTNDQDGACLVCFEITRQASCQYT